MLVTGEKLTLTELRVTATRYGIYPLGMSKKDLEKAINAKIEELRKN
jgi:hypothetical protein